LKSGNLPALGFKGRLAQSCKDAVYQHILAVQRPGTRYVAARQLSNNERDVITDENVQFRPFFMSSFEIFWDLVLWQLALQTRHRLFDSISNSEHFKCNMSVFDMFLLIQSVFFSSRITG